MMTGPDLLAAIATGVTSAALALRANMLKPHFGSWYTAPRVVWLPLALLSIVMASVSFQLWRGVVHTPALFALAFFAQAVVSVSLLWNLARQSASRHGGPHP